MAEPSILTTSPNAVNSPGMPFKTIQVAKGTETTNTANRVAGTYFFTTATHGSFAVGDHVHHTAITKGTQVTDIDTGTGTIYLSKPLAATLNSGETVTILSDRVGAAGGPPAFELKAGTNITIASAAVNNSGAAIIEISASGGSTLDIDGLSDIGAALVDADIFPVDDGANGTNRKATMSRLKTYMTTSGLLTVSGTDHRMVRMDGTAAIQDTGMTIDDSDNITGVASLTASATVTAADLTATDDVTVGDDLIVSDGSKIKVANTTGTNVAGDHLALFGGTGTGTGAGGRIDFYTKSADGSSSGAHSVSNSISMTEGKLGIGTIAPDTALDIESDLDSEFTALSITNKTNSSNTNGFTSVLFNLGNSTNSTLVDAAKISVKKENAFTSTASSQDATIEFHTSLNGTLTKRMEIKSESVEVTGDLAVTGDLNITGDINSVSVTNLDVDDLTITLAKGASDSAGADGAGFSIDGASASMLYSDTGTKFTINKPLDITGNLNVTGTLTGDTSLTLDSTTISTAEIGVLDGVTAGTVTASKAVVVDGSKDIGAFNSISTEFAKHTSTQVASGTINVSSTATIATINTTTHRGAEILTTVYNTTDNTTDLFKTVVMWDGHDTQIQADDDVYYTNYAVLSSGDVSSGDISAVRSSANILVKFTATGGSNAGNDTYIIRSQQTLLEI